jgi:ATP-dependent helicase/nuclease subunit A
VSLLVEAGAGSGKTTALVSRMVAMVREGAAEVTEIAAVTFTRKAAGELRERFQEALERERLTEGLVPAARARLERALHQLDRAFMGTIHAFCARLLRERPIEAGIDPGFLETTAAEAGRLAARYWGLHLERLAASGDPILGDLEDVGLTPADLRTLYDQVRENLDVEYPLHTSPPPDPAVVALVRGEVDALLDEAARLLPAEEPRNGWDKAQPRLRSVIYIRRYRPWSDDRVFLDALADLTRSSWDVTQYKWADDKAGKLAAKNLERRLNALRTGDAMRLLEEWWAHRYPIAMRFALGAARELEKHRRASGHLDFQDLLVLSAGLLRGSPEARAALGARWKRILVDEFQDTDPLQAEVLFLLASESAGDGGDWTLAVPRPGALFVVGDPKQSIYRFRRADIALYTHVRERFAAFGSVLELTANFRSGQPVADLVNAMFAPPDGFPEHPHPAQAAFAPLLPQPRAEGGAPGGVFHYVVDTSGKRREEVATWSASALAGWIARRVGPGGDRRPADFLILTRKKDQLEAYARALESRNLPVRVSGAGVGVEEEIAELTLLLEALTDPSDPSLTVAVLVGPFFGIDHDQLVEHKEGGRSLDLRYARGAAEDPDPVEAALGRMKAWWELARREPADVVVQRIVSELGLLAYAAAGELGSIRAGALAYVLDSVRVAGLAGDTSLTGALGALDTALLDDEAEAPLEPGRSDTIRLMNLHKAKGLEAPIVVLAAPYGEWEHPIDRHIERGTDGRARGWLAVEKREGFGHRLVRRIQARPAEWEEKRAAEEVFASAEDLRLLYVAATRAAEELVIARNGAYPDRSPWSRFDPWLDRLGLALPLAPAEAPERERLTASAAEILSQVRSAEAERAAAASPTFAFESVTQAAKGAEPVAEEPVRDSPPAGPDEAPGGYEWGSAVHGVLEAAARGAAGERLHAVARSLLLELDRPVSNGEPLELDKLIETVNRVRSHELWRRAMASGRYHAEVPFAVQRAEGKTPVYLEGVIDLVFREPDGWVVVDYKTDKGDDPAFATRLPAYREQLRIYSRAWEELSGEPVKERRLWFVRTGLVESVP